jgi:copper chaperone CopZ
MLWGVTVLAIGFLFFPSYVGVFLGTADDSALSENMNQAVFKIDGMTCEGCSAIVAKAVKTVPGVLAVEVNYEKGEAIVGTELCCPIPSDEVLAALDAACYSAVVIEDSTK